MTTDVAGAPPAGGAAGPAADADRFRAHLLDALGGIVALVPEAERTRRFPREAVERLGAAGVFRERWAAPTPALGAVLAEELGLAGAGGVGLGVTVHSEAALAILLRHGSTPLLEEVAREALAGTSLLAVAATERAGGSDLTAIETELADEGPDLRVRGVKSFVSLGGCADHLIVSCREAGPSQRPRVSLVLVPREGVRIEKRHDPLGARAMETVRVAIDARVPSDAVIGRRGAGMTALAWGLTHERFATAAITIGTAELAIGLATAHLHSRRSGGEPLASRQAPRLMLARHAAEVAVLRRAAHSLAAQPFDGARAMREVAGLKVTAARAGERVLSDCMHVLGGTGFLEDESPLARLWRDVRLARLGGGTDEIMWELVAGGLIPAEDAYRALVEGGG